MKIEPVIKRESRAIRKSRAAVAKAKREEYAKELNLPDVVLPKAMQDIVDKEPVNDLDNLGPVKNIALQLLIDRAAGGVWGKILAKYDCKWEIYSTSRFASLTYKKLGDVIEEAVKAMRVARTEDNLFLMAMGEVPVNKKVLPPDVKAAGLYLQGNDSRYSQEKTQQATQVVINLGGGLKVPGQ